MCVYNWIALLATLYFPSGPDIRSESDVRCRGRPPPDFGWIYSTVARQSVAMILEFGCCVPRQSLPFFGSESASVFRSEIYYRFSVGNLQSCHVSENRLEFPVRKTVANPVRQRALLNPIWRQACPMEQIPPHSDLLESDVGKGWAMISNRELVVLAMNQTVAWLVVK